MDTMRGGRKMKVDNGIIVEATREELRSYWLSRGFDDVYPFDDFVDAMRDAGTKVVDEDGYA